MMETVYEWMTELVDGKASSILPNQQALRIVDEMLFKLCLYMQIVVNKMVPLNVKVLLGLALPAHLVALL